MADLKLTYVYKIAKLSFVKISKFIRVTKKCKFCLPSTILVLFYNLEKWFLDIIENNQSRGFIGG